MDSALLRQLREAELQLVVPLLRPGATVLELGAGSGWQARRLAEQGFSVRAIDVCVPDRVFWEVTRYDGRNLPFADGSFDQVFSSNVLEHVEDLAQMLREMRRVLKPGGTSIHLVPSASWRIWTSIVHYPYMARQAVRRMFGARLAGVSAGGGGESGAAPQLQDVLFAERHGAHRSMLWEIYGFSARHWQERLTSIGDCIARFAPSGIYYSGYGLLGSVLRVPARRRLSRVLGSSCHLVVLRHDVQPSPRH